MGVPRFTGAQSSLLAPNAQKRAKVATISGNPRKRGMQGDFSVPPRTPTTSAFSTSVLLTFGAGHFFVGRQEGELARTLQDV